MRNFLALMVMVSTLVLAGCKSDGLVLTKEGEKIASNMSKKYDLKIGIARKVVRAIGGSEDPALVLSVAGVLGSMDPEFEKGKNYGFLGLHESYVGQDFAKQCGVETVEDLYDVEKSVCVFDGRVKVYAEEHGAVKNENVYGFLNEFYGKGTKGMLSASVGYRLWGTFSEVGNLVKKVK
jgi:hypothetical protein